MKLCIYNLIISTAILTNCGQINHALPRDFKNLGHLAKNWGEKAFHEWAWKKITSSEAVAIGKYSYKDYKQINKYLNETKGILVKDNDILSAKYNVEDLNKKIRLISSGLEKATIPEPLKVYRRVEERFFNISNLLLRDSNKNVNLNVVSKIKQDFFNKKVPFYSFLSTSLINEPQSAEFHHYDYPILMEIYVPPGINGAFLGDSVSYFKDEYELLINRGYYFKYKQFSIIDEFDTETLKVDVEIDDQKAI